jgi:hypothetical protein
MEIVSMLRVLRRRRLLVAVGALLSLLAGAAIVAQAVPVPAKLTGRDAAIGAASGRVLLAAAPQRTLLLQAQLTDSLGTRAQLLANLVATDDERTAIARAAGLAPDQVSVRGPSSGPPTLATPLAVEATQAATLSGAPYGLAVTTDPQVPIVSLKATGPDAARAARVVNAATDRLDELIARRSSGAPQIRIERLGPSVRSTIVEYAHPAAGVAVAFVMFGLWCAGIIIVSGLVRSRHVRRAGYRHTAGARA